MNFFLLMNGDHISMYSQTQFVRKFFNSNNVILACFFNTLFLHFHTLHTFTSLFYIYTYAEKKILTFSLIMTEVRSKRRVFLPLVFTSNTFKSMESMVFDYK